MILPEGWRSKRETSSSPHDLGPADNSWEERDILPEDWKGKRETSSSPNDPGPEEEGWGKTAEHWTIKKWFPGSDGMIQRKKVEVEIIYKIRHQNPAK